MSSAGAYEPPNKESQGGDKKLFPGFWVPTLYMAEGLPFICVAVVSVYMYKAFGLTDADIAFFTSIVGLPWALKPLWSPFLEMFKTKKFFVLVTQFGGAVLYALLVFSLAPLLTSELPANQEQIRLSLAAFGLIAFNSATHDIVADGVYIQSLTNKEQAQFSGWQGASWNAGKFLAQGALVWIAGYMIDDMKIGVVQTWLTVMGAFGAILALFGLYHLKVLPTGGSEKDPPSLSEAYANFFDILRDFLRKKYVLWGMLFVVLFRFSEGQQVKIVPLFFQAARADGGLALTTKDMGLAVGIFGAGAFMVGSLSGGYFVANRGLRKSLLPLCMLFNVPNAVYAFLAFTTPESFVAISAAIIFEWFGYGFGFVGVTLFMMQQIAPGKYKMAHYSFATALMSIGLLAPSAVSGIISDFLGYKMFFLWVVLATLPSFFVAWKVPFKTDDHFEAEAAASNEVHTYERPVAFGAGCIIFAVVSLFVGLTLSIGWPELGNIKWAPYSAALISLVTAILWFKSPVVARAGELLAVQTGLMSRKVIKLADITSVDVGTNEVKIVASGETVTVALQSITPDARTGFTDYASELATAA